MYNDTLGISFLAREIWKFNEMLGEKSVNVVIRCYVFVFNPRWDMHSLRAKEIKDSLNSQVVPKILVLLKNGTVWFHNCSG